MRLTIIGAGMAGLLAGNMLRRYSPVLREAQSELPDNHGALLRFRSDAVEKATGIRLHRVNVLKAVKYRDELLHTADLKVSNLYSLKVSGKAMARSILDLSPGVRYIAPDDFLDVMARGAGTLMLGAPVDRGTLHNLLGDGSPVISTIPMTHMMNLVNWKDRPSFQFKEIWSVRYIITGIPVDVYQTIYYPDPDTEWYRASITGDLLTVEFVTAPDEDLDYEKLVRDILEDFGIYGDISVSSDNLNVKYQRYGKLLPIPEEQRRAFIFGLSNEYNIYSVGRFATWRQILLDDVVQDVNKVAGFILDKGQYERHLSRIRE